MSYTTEQARHLYNMAFALELSGREVLKNSDVVVRECNGLGPNWMPDSMRKVCSKLSPVMEVPAAIHDMRYALGRTQADRNEADMEFLTNCIKVINHDYAWYNPMRYIMSKRAVRYFTYLQLFGGAAWEEARKHDR